MATFVCIIGNVAQGIFKLGVADDPLARLAALQEGNPHKLSLVSKIRLKDKNSALAVEAIGRKRLKQYEGAGQWYLGVPSDLSAQFISNEYLRLLASGANIQLDSSKGYMVRSSTASSHRLAKRAQKEGLTYDDILSRVEQAYHEGLAIDELI